MTKDEENRLYINLLARSMALFPLWAEKHRTEYTEGGDSQNGQFDNKKGL